MPQYLADIKEKEFFIEGAEAHHLAGVARHKEGDEITVFDGKGKQYTARITRIQKDFVRGELLKQLTIKKSAISLELCFAPTSRTTLEDVLDKCTQLGVMSFQPIWTARSEYDLSKKWEQKTERWNQIILSACKQSQHLLIRLPTPRPVRAWRGRRRRCRRPLPPQHCPPRHRCACPLPSCTVVIRNSLSGNPR